MESIYKIEFNYVSNPKKIALPFVAYKPNKTIWFFGKVLNEVEKHKIIKIAKTLNEYWSVPVQYTEYLYSEKQKQWVIMS
jgi:hypothetical protein